MNLYAFGFNITTKKVNYIYIGYLSNLMARINFEVDGDLSETISVAKKTGRFRTNAEVIRYGLSLVRKELRAEALTA